VKASHFQAHIDEPGPTDPVDSSDVTVRGWVAVDTGTAQIAAVEVWQSTTLRGSTASLYLRADVVKALGLPPHDRNGFTLSGLSVEGDAPLSIKLLLADGRRETVASIGGGAWKQASTPLGVLRKSITRKSVGLEIGAHLNPVPGLDPFYTDSVASFAGTEGKVDFLSDATALPIPDNSLDYLCSSHVLEHIPNPLAALFEWHRVLKPGGKLYLVVPDKRYTFDCAREITSARHILDDFFFKATSLTRVLPHIDEFVFKSNWQILRPDCPKEDEAAQRAAAKSAYLEQIRKGEFIDIHFHTFTPASLHSILVTSGLLNARNGFRALSWAERYPPHRRDGAAVLLEKVGAARNAISSDAFRLPNPRNPDSGGQIPLVCPVTLSPLRMENGGDRRVLLATSGARYQFNGACPVLLPPAGSRISRQWNSALRRSLTYIRGICRTTSSAETKDDSASNSAV
jgi:SAM-dependent methyltransferase